MPSAIAFRRMLHALVVALAVLAALAPAAGADGAGATLDESPHGDPRGSVPDALVTRAVAQADLATVEPSTPAAVAPGLPATWCGDADPTSDDTVHATVPPTVAQLKLVYVHASDQPNRFADWAGRLQATASVLGRYVATASGGRKTLRWDLGTACSGGGSAYADISVVHLPRPLSAYNGDVAARFGLLDDDVRAALGIGARGPASGPRNLVVYADGFFMPANGIAGQGSVYRGCCGTPAPDSPSFRLHDAGGLSAVVYGPQTPPANGLAWPGPMLHEITHTLGGVQDSAPHSSGAGHCGDRYDVMCYPDGGPTYAATYPCPTQVGQAIPDTYDCGGDDYFNAAPAAGSYLATHWNVYNAAHLAPCSEVPLTCGAAAGADPAQPLNTTPPAGTSWRRSYAVDLGGTSAASPVESWQWRVDGGPVQTTRTATVTGTGLHTLETRVGDAAGGWSAWRAETVRIDAEDPVVALSCPDAWQRTSATCSIGASDTGGSGVARVTLQDGDGTPIDVSGTQRTLSAHGEHRLTLRATDGAGGTAAAVAVARVDTTAPVVSLRCPADATPRAEDCTLTAADPESGVAVRRLRIDGELAVTLAGDGLPAFGDGEHRLELQAVNGAGAASAWSPAALLRLRTAVRAATVIPATPATAGTRMPAARTGTGAAAVVLRRGTRRVGRGRVIVAASRITAVLDAARLPAGAWRLRVCSAGRRCTVRAVRLRRPATPRSLRAVVPAAGGATRVTFTVLRRTGGRLRTFASATAAATRR